MRLAVKNMQFPRTALPKTSKEHDFKNIQHTIIATTTEILSLKVPFTKKHLFCLVKCLKVSSINSVNPDSTDAI